MQPRQEQNCGYLDSYKLIKQLGAGAQANVYLGEDINGTQYAIKIYKNRHSSEDISKQFTVMKNLNHQNLVKLIEIRQNALYKMQDQSTHNCIAIILQYVNGGQLFDFINLTGRFSEDVARTYFKQMIYGLKYIHDKGYAHRDLKPQNILISGNFVLKIADFGLSALNDKYGTGILHTRVGTQGYMAPQIKTNNYVGQKVDVFAAGVILYIMFLACPPFQNPTDQHYRMIKSKNYEKYWQTRRKPPGFFSNQFKNLFMRMVSYDQNQRISIAQIIQHPWFNKNCSKAQQIHQQFSLRIQKLKEKLQQQRIAQQNQRNTRMRNVGNRQTNRGELDQQNEAFMELYQLQLQVKRNIKPLQPTNRDDFVICQGVAYTVSVLKDFFQKRKVTTQDQLFSTDKQTLSLIPSKLHDEENKIICEYQLTQDIQGISFTQKLNIQVTIGKTKNNKLTIGLTSLSGNRFYFKKIAKQIKNLFLYCLV